MYTCNQCRVSVCVKLVLIHIINVGYRNKALPEPSGVRAEAPVTPWDEMFLINIDFYFTGDPLGGSSAHHDLPA